MATTTTNSGHTAKAIRLFNEPELFLAIAVGEPWDNEEVPPAPAIAALNVGRIHAQAYAGDSLNAGNTYAQMNRTAFVGVLKNYKITALGTNTYDVRDADTNVLVGASSYPASDTRNDAAIPGVSLFVTSLVMEAGDTLTFTVDGVLGYKKVEERYLVVADPTGEIDYEEQRWKIVPPSEAHERGVRHVYVKATLRYNELPIGIQFRQLGIMSGVTRAGGVSGAQVALLPSEVASIGALEQIENRISQSRAAGQKETYSYVIEQ